MSHLVFHRRPNLRQSTLVAAFSGWPDAQEAASRSLRYLIRKLSAEKFAEVEPEEFYVFSRVRPRVRLDQDGTRRLRWPSNTFYSWHDETTSRDMVFLVGAEPNLKWNTYAKAIMEVAHTCDVARMVVLGSLLDATPHTREPGITGLATEPETRELFAELGIAGSRYQGPTGVPSVLMESCAQEGLSYASMWVHSPHYLQASPNPKASYTLLRRLLQVLDLDVDLSDLSGASLAFRGPGHPRPVPEPRLAEPRPKARGALRQGHGPPRRRTAGGAARARRGHQGPGGLPATAAKGRRPLVLSPRRRAGGVGLAERGRARAHPLIAPHRQ